jgi:hypothetical protein
VERLSLRAAVPLAFAAPLACGEVPPVRRDRLAGAQLTGFVPASAIGLAASRPPAPR